jgi:hypothetical protein
VLELAVERGELARNPCRHLGRLLTKVKRQQSTEVAHGNSWTRAEVSTLLTIARREESRFSPLFLFLL